jgi:hypothetical protein
MPVLTAQDLLAGSKAIHEVEIPPEILIPGGEHYESAESVYVRIRPLNVITLSLISRAARDDASLVPLLMIKEAVVEPALGLDQIRQMHIGLVHFLVSRINLLSGLSADGQALRDAVDSPLGQTHLLLAKHFGWTPDQVSQLTPGQVAVYLAGIERLLQLEKQSEKMEGV